MASSAKGRPETPSGSEDEEDTRAGVGRGVAFKRMRTESSDNANDDHEAENFGQSPSDRYEDGETSDVNMFGKDDDNAKALEGNDVEKAIENNAETDDEDEDELESVQPPGAAKPVAPKRKPPPAANNLGAAANPTIEKPRRGKKQPPPVKPTAVGEHQVESFNNNSGTEESQEPFLESEMSDGSEPVPALTLSRPRVASVHVDAVREEEAARKQGAQAPVAAPATLLEGKVDEAILNEETIFVQISVSNNSAAIVPKEDIVHAVMVGDDDMPCQPFEIAFAKNQDGSIRNTNTSRYEMQLKMLDKDYTRVLRSVVLVRLKSESDSGKQITMQALLPAKFSESEATKAKEVLNQVDRKLPGGYTIVYPVDPRIVSKMYKIERHGLPTKYQPNGELVKYKTLKNLNVEADWRLVAEAGATGRSSGSKVAGKRSKVSASAAAGGSSVVEEPSVDVDADATPAAPVALIEDAASEPALASKRAKGAAAAAQKRSGQRQLSSMFLNDAASAAAANGPAEAPTSVPTSVPTSAPTSTPTSVPTSVPTSAPTSAHTSVSAPASTEAAAAEPANGITSSNLCTALDVTSLPAVHPLTPDLRGWTLTLSVPAEVTVVRADPQHLFFTFATKQGSRS